MEGVTIFPLNSSENWVTDLSSSLLSIDLRFSGETAKSKKSNNNNNNNNNKTLASPRSSSSSSSSSSSFIQFPHDSLHQCVVDSPRALIELVEDWESLVPPPPTKITTTTTNATSRGHPFPLLMALDAEWKPALLHSPSAEAAAKKSLQKRESLLRIQEQLSQTNKFSMVVDENVVQGYEDDPLKRQEQIAMEKQFHLVVDDEPCGNNGYDAVHLCQQQISLANATHFAIEPEEFYTEAEPYYIDGLALGSEQLDEPENQDEPGNQDKANEPEDYSEDSRSTSENEPDGYQIKIEDEDGNEWKQDSQDSTRDQDDDTPSEDKTVKKAFSTAAILQVACNKASTVWIIDLHTICAGYDHDTEAEWRSCIEKLDRFLQSPHVVKLGWKFHSDIAVLAKSFESIGVFRTLPSYIEVDELYRYSPYYHLRSRRPEEIPKAELSYGLGVVTKKVLFMQLNKAQQCSNWEERPLTQYQLDYASLDVVILLVLASRLLFQSDVKKFDAYRYAKFDRDKLTPFFSTIRSIVKGQQRNGTKLSAEELERQEKRRKKREEARRKSFINRFACKRPVYENCVILAPSGKQMCFCDLKKIGWYLERNLATVVCRDPMTIQLTFEPNITNPDKDHVTCLAQRRNSCVICGEGSYYTRFHVVPSCYRKLFPVEFKSHKSHDVVLTCVDCHQLANKRYGPLTKMVAQLYDAPENGFITRATPEMEVSFCKAAKAARAIMHPKSNIPADRLAKLEDDIRTYYYQNENVTSEEKNSCSPSSLSSCSETSSAREITQQDMEAIVEMYDKYKQEQKGTYVGHGELVMMKMKQAGSKDAYFEQLKNFVRFWRRGFLKVMEPKYLPEDWSVDYDLDSIQG